MFSRILLVSVCVKMLKVKVSILCHGLMHPECHKLYNIHHSTLLVGSFLFLAGETWQIDGLFWIADNRTSLIRANHKSAPTDLVIIIQPNRHTNKSLLPKTKHSKLRNKWATLAQRSPSKMKWKTSQWVETLFRPQNETGEKKSTWTNGRVFQSKISLFIVCTSIFAPCCTMNKTALYSKMCVCVCLLLWINEAKTLPSTPQCDILSSVFVKNGSSMATLMAQPPTSNLCSIY